VPCKDKTPEVVVIDESDDRKWTLPGLAKLNPYIGAPYDMRPARVDLQVTETVVEEMVGPV
jgi:hypothetical protein